MTNRAALLALLVLPLTALSAGKGGPDALNRNVAGRVFLSNGDVMEVVYSVTSGTNTAVTTISTRDMSTGAVLTVHERIDYGWMKTETTISDGRTTIVVKEDLGYYTDKLPVPIQVKIGPDVYRALLRPNSITDDQKKLQAAVAKLPSSFVTGLKHLIPIGSSLDFTTASLPALSDLFDGAIEMSITMTKKMETAEIDALVRDAAR